MSYESTYPVNMPTQAAKDAYQIIRDGELASRRAQFGAAVWNIQGWLQGQVLGTPDAQPVWSESASVSATIDEPTALATLQQLAGEGDATQAIAPALIVMVVKYLLSLLLDRVLT